MPPYLSARSQCGGAPTAAGSSDGTSLCVRVAAVNLPSGEICRPRTEKAIDNIAAPARMPPRATLPSENWV